MKTRIPTDSIGVFGGLTTSQKLALVRSTALPPGISGFLLDVIDEDQVDLTSEITDHYVEDNTSIQDHIALRPEVVTLHGVVSELSVLRAPVSNGTLRSDRDSLPANDEMMPRLTIGALQKKKYDTPPTPPKGGVLTKYENEYGRIGYQNGNKQQDVFNFLYQVWKGRQFVTVETAWGIWPLMAVQSIRSEQPKDSRHQSEFWVTFKAIRFAEEIMVKAIPTEQGRAGDQMSDTVNNGVGGRTAADFQSNSPLTASLLLF